MSRRHHHPSYQLIPSLLLVGSNARYLLVSYLRRFSLQWCPMNSWPHPLPRYCLSVGQAYAFVFQATLMELFSFTWSVIIIKTSYGSPQDTLCCCVLCDRIYHAYLPGCLPFNLLMMSYLYVSLVMMHLPICPYHYCSLVNYVTKLKRDHNSIVSNE